MPKINARLIAERDNNARAIKKKKVIKQTNLRHNFYNFSQCHPKPKNKNYSRLRHQFYEHVTRATEANYGCGNLIL